MARDEKDDKYYFIKEEITPKKRINNKHIKKILSLIFSGIIIGFTASVIIVIFMPALYKFLCPDPHTPPPIEKDVNYNPTLTQSPKENDNNDESNNVDGNKEDSKEDPIDNCDDTDKDIKVLDFYTETNKIVSDANKSILKIRTTIKSKDIFDNIVEKSIETTAIIISIDENIAYLLTSLDRVKDAYNIDVFISNDKVLKAYIHDYESDLNLAIIKINIVNLGDKIIKDLQLANIGESYGLKIGQPIIALGSPNGYQMSVATGIISSKGSLGLICDNQYELFNTDIKDTKDSDGFIINYDGEIIGIITRTFKEGLNKDINTVIGISRMKPLLLQMVKGEKRAYLGIHASDMTDKVLKSYNINNGIYVDEVDSKSPAFLQGIKSGDIIMSINDKKIGSIVGYNRIISGFEIGEEVSISIKRTLNMPLEDMEIKVKIATKPNN